MWWLEVRKKVQDYGIVQDDVRMLWLGAVCTWWLAWLLGAVHVVGVIQLSRSSQASSWLEHQDDFSGFTCIGYRERT